LVDSAPAPPAHPAECGSSDLGGIPALLMFTGERQLQPIRSLMA
jgi:hypothetical protein